MAAGHCAGSRRSAQGAGREDHPRRRRERLARRLPLSRRDPRASGRRARQGPMPRARPRAALEASKLVAETSAKVQSTWPRSKAGRRSWPSTSCGGSSSEFDDRELVARAARNALADFRDAKSVTIKVHPIGRGACAAGDRRHRRQGRRGRVQTCAIETDPEIGERDCVLSTEFAVVEATIDTQLAAIAQAMGLRACEGVQR